jgi:glycosyltransferase involved in cell wall biosynthesis
MNFRVAAIIPALNEEKTIEGVVRVIVSSKDVNEVIVVSDGSKDETAARARSAGARVIELLDTVGKGSAMRKGVDSTNAEIILFLDADLKGLSTEHISLLLRPVISGDLKMNVGLRDRGKFSRIVGPRLPLVSGERAMIREVFEIVPDEHLRGYMVEASLNFACRSRKWKYGSAFMSGLKIRTKVDKVGFRKAVPQYIKMWAQVCKAFWIVRFAYARGIVNKF